MVRIFALMLACVCSLYGSQSASKHQESIHPLIPQEKIAERITEIGAQLSEEYEELTIVMIMKGAICLGADLMRAITIPTTFECIQCDSYHNGKRGELTIKDFDELDLTGKHVLLIDDVIDSGVTMATTARMLEEKRPASLRSLVLLSKTVDRQREYTPDYILFEVEDRFVVGYGIDYNECYRGLPDICWVEV